MHTDGKQFHHYFSEQVTEIMGEETMGHELEPFFFSIGTSIYLCESQSRK